MDKFLDKVAQTVVILPALFIALMLVFSLGYAIYKSLWFLLALLFFAVFIWADIRLEKKKKLKENDL